MPEKIEENSAANCLVYVEYNFLQNKKEPEEFQIKILQTLFMISQSICLEFIEL